MKTKDLIIGFVIGCSCLGLIVIGGIKIKNNEKGFHDCMINQSNCTYECHENRCRWSGGCKSIYCSSNNHLGMGLIISGIVLISLFIIIFFGSLCPNH